MKQQLFLGREIFFKISCPGLQRDVILYEHTWYGHIMTEHPKMDGRRPLVEQVVKNLKSADIFQYTTSAPEECFTEFNCVHFRPFNDYLRVAFKVLDKTTALVTSAYNADKSTMGVKNYVAS